MFDSIFLVSVKRKKEPSLFVLRGWSIVRPTKQQGIKGGLTRKYLVAGKRSRVLLDAFATREARLHQSRQQFLACSPPLSRFTILFPPPPLLFFFFFFFRSFTRKTVCAPQDRNTVVVFFAQDGGGRATAIRIWNKADLMRGQC